MGVFGVGGLASATAENMSSLPSSNLPNLLCFADLSGRLASRRRKRCLSSISTHQHARAPAAKNAVHSLGVASRFARGGGGVCFLQQEPRSAEALEGPSPLCAKGTCRRDTGGQCVSEACGERKKDNNRGNRVGAIIHKRHHHICLLCYKQASKTHSGQTGQTSLA